MRAQVYGLLATIAVVSCIGTGYAAGRKTAPTPAPPAYQQVTYAGAGLLQALNYQGLAVADLTFDTLTPLRKGYRVTWLVTEGDGTVGKWVVRTTAHGAITSIALDGKRRVPSA